MTTTSPQRRVAVIYQAIEPPVVNGVRKPMKPGGYKDSSADIAYCLRTHNTAVVTPVTDPDVGNNDDYAWCFPDTEAGILAALEAGATHLWANTILFASHPLQTSAAIGRFAAEHAREIKVVGQPPLQVELFDDKEVVNDMLRAAGGFTMPLGWTLVDPATTTTTITATGNDAASALRDYIAALSLPYPVVGKPIRGRGSHGVRVCASLDEMVAHAAALFRESPRIMVEEYLAGEEGTVTVMPPPPESRSPSQAASTGEGIDGGGGGGYRALPVVRRTNHHDGIAPYNGTVAVSANSRAVGAAESAADPAYALAQRECERAAEMLGVAGVMRIDIRRRRRQQQQSHGGDAEGELNKFCLFDVNVKPNMTGPGRPGRDDQACLSLLAAQELGWDYGRLLHEMLDTAVPLDELRRRALTLFCPASV
ncbi:hypothetical protein Micbo1qcDRAFT_231198 [Microdochium bolleyi]|uniref:ATP-grasp domain-containing protein n=1 Tax=Microdochium bolleyi TaxID=196109 RepID=A0A136JFZ1_9PEZI|nr:hypothetical protein Micbo1qcDRAFT_231198 [Microdochium bolleyi]